MSVCRRAKSRACLTTTISQALVKHYCQLYPSRSRRLYLAPSRWALRKRLPCHRTCEITRQYRQSVARPMADGMALHNLLHGPARHMECPCMTYDMPPHEVYNAPARHIAWPCMTASHDMLHDPHDMLHGLARHIAWPRTRYCMASHEILRDPARHIAWPCTLHAAGSTHVVPI